MFSHELDLLELRLGILNDHVDYFVITESQTTFSGVEKPLFYLQNSDRYSQWADKIIYNVINIPDFDSPWDREKFSRNSPLNSIQYADEDIIMSGCLDEIPRPESVDLLPDLLKNNFSNHVTFQQSMYVYYLNNFDTNNWYGTRAATFGYLKNCSIDDMHESTEDDRWITGPILRDAGWHFTSCGGADSVRRKIESFSHSELNRTDIIDNIENNIKTNGDLYYRDKKYSYVPIDESFPQYLRNNMDKYSHLIYKGVD